MAVAIAVSIAADAPNHAPNQALINETLGREDLPLVPRPAGSLC